MPQVVAGAWVPAPPDVAFAVSQTTGAVRLRWDPFIREQHLLDADAPGKDVRTLTRSSVGPGRGLRMVSRYVSYRPPTSVGMTMEEGPWFFASFGGGWRFEAQTRAGVAGTLATWKYTYAVRPRLLRGVAEPLGQRLLGREIRARIEAFRTACGDPVVLAAAT
ncbi:SRPBCC family protein [Microlunatus flavus]|uniref:Polyketide cyclase / dehydrase and lipid transport n=1 Tax=Microlunatus flavus TaxID=1036181 RepID=A0A1H9HB26_9ACTN|nr:SRPBCC family protein [Microlunatus flavus]SEQ59483.1 hypothetical protein SAMN05421756_104176 [Microlunatus flavus]